MGKTRGLFKKIEDIKGTFNAKMGMINDRYGKDLTEETRRGGKNTQKNYTRYVSMTWITTMVCSLTQGWTSWNVKSSGPQEASL